MPSTLSREPWSKYYSGDTLKKKCPELTAYRLLRKATAKDPDNIAIRCHGFKITYGELQKKIDHLADCFASFGVEKGDRVALITTIFPEIIESFYALNKIGATAFFISPLQAADKLKDAINSADCKLCIVIDQLWPSLEPLVPELKVGRIIVQRAVYSFPAFQKFAFYLSKAKIKIHYGKKVGSFRFFENQFCSKHAEEAPYDESRVSVVLPTGGTTGSPKYVMLNDLCLNASVYNIHMGGFGNKRSEIMLSFLPMFYSYGMVCGVHAPLSLGIHLVVEPDFTPERFPELIAKYRPNHTIAVPAFYEKLMSHPKTKNLDYSQLILWASGGDTMSLSLEEKLEKFLLSHGAPFPIHQGYGMTEVSSVTTVAWNHKAKRGSVGFPAIYTEVRIFSPETGEQLPAGQEGEICIGGDTLMLGYYNNTEETEKVLKVHPDGRCWIHSGDIGYMDEDGFLFVSGRIKRMIRDYDMHKIYPTQIEEVILRNFLVRNCVVIGVNDRDHSSGQYPLAIVEPEQACTDPERIRRELKTFCNANLEAYDNPIDIIVIDKIPLTAVGKNDVTALTKAYGNYKYSL